MKINSIKSLLLFCFVCGSLLAVHAQGETKLDSLQRKFNTLSNSADPQDKVKLQSELYGQLKSKEEKNWLLAMNFFNRLEMNATADSLGQVIRKKFPRGEFVRNTEVQKVYDEVVPEKKEALLLAWLKKFPPQKFPSEQIIYDYARHSVGSAYARAGNSAKAVEYAGQLQSKVWIGEGSASIGQMLLQKGDTLSALPLLQKAILNAEEFKKAGKKDNETMFVLTGYPAYCRIYAKVLADQRKYNEALAYMTKVPFEEKPFSGQEQIVYASILSALGRNVEAFCALDKMLSEQEMEPQGKTLYKKLYVKLNGSEQGYEEFLRPKRDIQMRKMKAEVSKMEVKEAAPAFSVKDADGNEVSFASLKGKVVVLDFWATWCTPCKKSFPAMQLAVDKYRDDPNVKFLFIHTWEKTEHPLEEATKYLRDNHYSFHLLMDTKDPVSKSNKMAKDYKLQGIPAKFVIDGDGNIRFKITGFSGSNEMAVQELSTMIDMAKVVKK
jgi:thiol-disulfide isomerase/thioredoxin